MHRFFSIVLVIGFLCACVAGYWYLNPQHLPSVFRNPAAGFEVPTPRSPVNNFKPPKF